MHATAIALLALAVQSGVPGPESALLGMVADSPGVSEERSRPVVRVQTPLEAMLAAESSGRARDGGPWSLRARLGRADREWVDRVAASLTLEEKASQLVVSWLEGGLPREGSPRWDRAMELVRERRVGGFIVGVGPGEETGEWLNRLQRESELPLLVMADLEWGPGTRLRGATVLPINMALAAAGGAGLAYEAGRITALEARAAGIHVALAPVADVNVNPANPVINTRAYGSDPGAVSERVAAFIEGARSGGLLTVAKHFPGHGDTETDSHLELPVLSVDRPRLEHVELRPFDAAVRARVDGVMTAHLSVPVLDPGEVPRPATLSPPILTGLLRDRLGFRGLVVTDGLHMDGVKESGDAGEVAVAALLAGADVLLIPPDEGEAIDAVVAAVRAGELSEARLDASVRRVLAAKAAVGLRTGRRSAPAAVRAELGRADHEAWARRVAERSMTLVRGRPGSLPLAVAGRDVLAVLYDDRIRGSTGQVFHDALEARGARVRTVRLSRGSDADDLDRVRRLAAAADAVVFASFSRAVPWKGALGIPDGVAALAESLSLDGAPVVSFGDPYLLRQMPGVATYLLAWSRTRVSQESAVRALLGEAPITGRLPIDLPAGYVVGDGLVVPGLPGITTLPVR